MKNHCVLVTADQDMWELVICSTGSEGSSVSALIALAWFYKGRKEETVHPKTKPKLQMLKAAKDANSLLGSNSPF